MRKNKGLLALSLISAFFIMASNISHAESPIEKYFPPEEISPDSLLLPHPDDLSLLDDVNVNHGGGLLSNDSGSITEKISLANVGMHSGISLSGNQLQSGVMFVLPSDLVITGAKLKLNIQLSGNNTDNDDLQLVLNGQHLGALPIGYAEKKNNTYTLAIPSSMVTTENNLSFRIISSGNIASDDWLCTQEISKNYQVTILSDSFIEYSGIWLESGRDLSKFPRPYFYPDKMNESKIDISYPEKPTSDVITASSIIASHLGVISTYKNVRFTALINQLPKRNGILVGKPGQKIGQVTIPDMDGPGIKIIENPYNTRYKLLIVSGKNTEDLQQAAWRLTNGTLPNSDILTVEKQSIAARKPYDAPRWISTEEPIPLKTLVKNEEGLISRGINHSEKKVYFRAAPDLFMWDGKTIPLKLSYTFPREKWLDAQTSHLNVSMNDKFIKQLPVNKEGIFQPIWQTLGFDTRQQQTTINIEPSSIYGDNHLNFYYAIKSLSGTPCNIYINSEAKSQIDGNSTLDLSGSYHYAALPNVSYFIGAMFPFSKYADFSQTVVLLPQTPSEAELQTLLEMMARAGDATGLAISRVQIALGKPSHTSDMPMLQDADIIAISTLNHEDFTQSILYGSQFELNGNTVNVIPPSMLKLAKGVISGNWLRDTIEARDYLASQNAWRGFLSFRSYWNPNRVVMLVTGTDEKELLKLPSDLKQPTINKNLRGDIAIISGDEIVKSFHTGEQFTTGDLPGYLKIIWYASQHVLVLSIIGIILSIITGLWLFQYLTTHANKRLSKNGKENA